MSSKNSAALMTKARPANMRTFGRLLCRATIAAGSYDKGRALLIDDQLKNGNQRMVQVKLKPRLPERAWALLTLQPQPQTTIKKLVRKRWKLDEIKQAIDEKGAELRTQYRAH